LKQFQENKKAIHPLLIEVEDFLLDIVKIPVTLSNNRVYTDIGYASVERNDEVYPLGSILPDLITEVQNDPKYQDYLK